jgi:hypothetical protein
MILEIILNMTGERIRLTVFDHMTYSCEHKPLSFTEGTGLPEYLSDCSLVKKMFIYLFA